MIDFAGVRGAIAVLGASADLFWGLRSGQVSSWAGDSDEHVLG
jgi:hypothetical protein